VGFLMALMARFPQLGDWDIFEGVNNKTLKLKIK
jgi:hypothetical protein